jgi:serine/threonine protein kinase
MIVGIASVLPFLHRRPIRDIKAGNVLFDQNLKPYLTDFGFAKWSKDEREGILHVIFVAFEWCQK